MTPLQLAALGALAIATTNRRGGGQGYGAGGSYPQYPFYVVVKATGQVISGWEYREDAKDTLDDTPWPRSQLAVMTHAGVVRKYGAVRWGTGMRGFGAAAKPQCVPFIHGLRANHGFVVTPVWGHRLQATLSHHFGQRALNSVLVTHPARPHDAVLLLSPSYLVLVDLRSGAQKRTHGTLVKMTGHQQSEAVCRLLFGHCVQC